MRACWLGLRAAAWVAGNTGLEGVYFKGGLTSPASRRADGREACGCVRGAEGGAGQLSVREGEESVDPVRAEGRALAPPLRGGAGARVRWWRKGRGGLRLSAICRRPPPPVLRVGGVSGGRRLCPLERGNGSGVSRAWLLGAAGRGREVCVPPPSRDPVGRRGLPEQRCHSPCSSCLFLCFRLLGSVAVLGKARCPVWLGIAAPRSCPALSLGGWEGPLLPGSYGGVRTYSCASAMSSAWGTRARCQSCCLCFALCRVDGTVELGE